MAGPPLETSLYGQRVRQGKARWPGRDRAPRGQRDMQRHRGGLGGRAWAPRGAVLARVQPRPKRLSGRIGREPALRPVAFRSLLVRLLGAQHVPASRGRHGSRASRCRLPVSAHA